MRIMLKSKIHGARVTRVNIDYEGSITIDKKLMEEADILPYEQVQVLNVNNGARFTTYAIEGKVSGEIGLNGAAARLAVKGIRLWSFPIAMLRMTKLIILSPSWYMLMPKTLSLRVKLPRLYLSSGETDAYYHKRDKTDEAGG